MIVAVVGLGYVGLVAAVCFAAAGHEVRGVEADPERATALAEGRPPLFEPGLDALLAAALSTGRLSFSADYTSLRGADVVLVAVGTPSGLDAAVDLSALDRAIAQLAPHLGEATVVVLKSTVPIGTNARVAAALAAAGRNNPVASNPEFLREGSAIIDFREPDRVLFGVTDPRAEATLRRLYAPLVAPDRVLVTDPASAELAKYAANTFLAARLSFLNELADVCTASGANIDEVVRGLASDRRIGPLFLTPSLGWGGSCFPKDVAALAALGDHYGLPLEMPRAVAASNRAHLDRWIDRVLSALDPVSGRVVAAWGLAFKANTDDVRHSPAMAVVQAVVEAGAQVRVHDPAARIAAQRVLGDRVVWATSAEDAVASASALLIGTEWDAYRLPPNPCPPVVCDGRNLWREIPTGVRYLCIGGQAPRQPGQRR